MDECNPDQTPTFITTNNLDTPNDEPVLTYHTTGEPSYLASQLDSNEPMMQQVVQNLDRVNDQVKAMHSTLTQKQKDISPRPLPVDTDHWS